ncbi:MAG TPA: hypothetical protein VIT20_06425, partial [Propionibacteriaceae bacterium]
ETDEAGLMVTSYQQVCSMRSVDVYATTEGFDQLARRLGTRPPTGQRMGECGLLRSSSGGRREPQVVVTRLQAGQFVAADEPGARNAPCAAPLLAYDGGAVRSGPTFDPAEIRPDRSWVTVVHEQQFLSQGLGCRGIVFCSSPVKASVLP